jgi:hypothetical protein
MAFVVFVGFEVILAFRFPLLPIVRQRDFPLGRAKSLIEYPQQNEVARAVASLETSTRSLSLLPGSRLPGWGPQKKKTSGREHSRDGGILPRPMSSIFKGGRGVSGFR